MSHWDNLFQSQATQANLRANDEARARKRTARKAQAIIDEQDETIDHLRAEVKRYKSLAYGFGKTIEYWDTCNPAPDRQILCSLALGHYSTQLCNADFLLGWYGTQGLDSRETLRRGLHRADKKPLTLMQKRDINLKLMVRAEFYFLAQVTIVLNRFQATMLEALTLAPNHHPELRDPRRIEICLKEINAHNAFMIKLEQAPVDDLSLQLEWEAERLAWWRRHAEYKDVTQTVPCSEAMRRRHPNIRLDDYHAAGRIAQFAKWDVIGNKEAEYFSKRNVAEINPYPLIQNFLL